MPRHDRERTDADSAPDRTRPTGRADATLRRPCSRASAFSGESATEQARRADERSPAPSVVAARAVPGAAARGTDERRAPGSFRRSHVQLRPGTFRSPARPATAPEPTVSGEKRSPAALAPTRGRSVSGGVPGSVPDANGAQGRTSQHRTDSARQPRRGIARSCKYFYDAALPTPGDAPDGKPEYSDTGERMVHLNSHLEQYAPLENFRLLPPGEYRVQITRSELKETRNGGPVLSFTYEIREGAFQGRRVWDYLRLWHANPVTAEIAMRQLKSIATASGCPNPNYIADSSELHGREMRIKVSIRRDECGNEYQSIRAYLPAERIPASPNAYPDAYPAQSSSACADTDPDAYPGPYQEAPQSVYPGQSAAACAPATPGAYPGRDTSPGSYPVSGLPSSGPHPIPSATADSSPSSAPQAACPSPRLTGAPAACETQNFPEAYRDDIPPYSANPAPDSPHNTFADTSSGCPKSDLPWD